MARGHSRFLGSRALGVAVGLAASALALALLPLPFVWIFLGWGIFCLDTSIRGRGGASRRVCLSLAIVFVILGLAEGVLAVKDEPEKKRKPRAAPQASAPATDKAKDEKKTDEPKRKRRKGRTSFVGADGEPVKYVELHDQLGHAPVPENVVIASKHYGDEALYEVSYTIGPDGLRVTPDFPEADGLPCILFFGGSFMFGEGIADEESLPYVVGVRTEGRYRALNFGFHAYGAHQMLSALEHGIVDEVADCEPRFVFYQAIVAHVNRAAGETKSDPHGPRYVLLQDGDLFLDGRFDDEASQVPAEQILPRTALYRGVISRSYVMKEIHEGTVGFSERLALFVAIVDRARGLVESRWPGAEFHVILWDERFQIRTLRLERALVGEGFRIQRISEMLPDYFADRDRYQLGLSDRHPNALAHAMIADHIVDEVLELRPAPSSAELFQAAFDGNLSTVDLALARGAEVDSTNPEGSTILMLAAFNGHTDVVRALLDHGASIDRLDLTGRTALMYASSGPYADTVGLLIEKGASVNLTDHGEGWSALMFAGGEGQVEVIRTLLAHGADAELVDEDGETALTFAQRNGHADAASLLQAAMKE